MTKAEINEIKRNYKPDSASIVRVAGCYVNGEKEKVCTFVKRFGNLDENEQFKYLEILTKTLSGKMDDRLVLLSFPTEEELSGGKYRSLNGLRDTALENEEALEAFYDALIDCYDRTGNYLILLFYDVIDIAAREVSGARLEDGTEQFRYIVVSVCPVELGEPGLSYQSETNSIGARLRDWTVKGPETGFMYPTLENHSQDVHHALFFTKDAKAPHHEVVTDILGCEIRRTDSEKRGAVKSIISGTVGKEQKELVEEAVSDFQFGLSEYDEQYALTYGEGTRLSVNREVIGKALENTELSRKDCETIAAKIDEKLASDETFADALIEKSYVKKGLDRAERKELLEKIDFLEAVNGDGADYRVVKIAKAFELSVREIDGVPCYVIPEDMLRE